jgi:hypothetical protein
MALWMKQVKRIQRFPLATGPRPPIYPDARNSGLAFSGAWHGVAAADFPLFAEVKAHELYNAVDPALVTQMLNWFRDHDRNVYRSALATLAQSKKLRLEFVQKKPVAEQYAWILKTLRAKQADTIGEHLLQAWFMAGNQPMLAAFCDAMGIEHDGKGSVTGDLPEAIDAAKLDAAVDSLAASYDPKLVSLYLHVFNLQVPGGWVPSAMWPPPTCLSLELGT